MIHATIESRARRAKRSRRAGTVVVLCLVTLACGKKGPPLAPLVRVPAAVTAVTPQRVGDDVYVSFTAPDTNADGLKPASIAALEVYAVTSERVPRTKKQRAFATLIATLPVRMALPPPVPANGSAPPPLPVPPGVEQGAAVAVKETLTAAAQVPVELPVDKDADPSMVVAAEDGPPFGPLVAPPPAQLPRRHYFVIGISPRGRESTPSTPVSLPLESGSSAPGQPVVAHTVSELTMTWTPPPDARTASLQLAPTSKPVPAGANVTPTTTTPAVPAALPPIVAKRFGLTFETQATRYNIYDLSPAFTPTESGGLRQDLAEAGPPPDPFAIKLPAPINPAPLLAPEFVSKGVVFGVERCFEVRPVDAVSGITLIGPASPKTCLTPQDTFPPAAPLNLAAIAGPGVINLIWDPNSETDLAGYIVLRGEAQAGTLGALQAITPEPITVTSYRDETVKPGTRYVYAVVAVDTAMPQNVSAQSNRAEETARQ